MVNDRAKPTRLRHVQPPVIHISPRALAVITAETKARFGPEETGGILLGHDLGHQILITAAGDPGPGAIHTPTRFRRDLVHAGKLADAAYEHDRSVWVGDWHTHPRGPTRPSRYELRTYRSFLDDPELDFDRFLTLIVKPQPPDSHGVASQPAPPTLALNAECHPRSNYPRSRRGRRLMNTDAAPAPPANPATNTNRRLVG
jgi:integrative and conjugative element protein (TIGR02256 family)